MPSNLLYMPTFRARQQEMIVLKSFTFGERIYPLIEIVKEKDRTNNPRPFQEIYPELVNQIGADKVLVDLPTYIRDSSGMQDEVVTFNRNVLSNLANRITYFNYFTANPQKIIPVVSTLVLKTGEANTLTSQFRALKTTFPSVAIRTFTNTFEIDFPEISDLLTENDFLIYDINEGVSLTNPILKKVRSMLDNIPKPWKVSLRSAINTDIQNVRLNHGDIVYEADNSLLEMFDTLHFNAFGDYVGIKKDDLTSGGTISPGFIIYNPADNLYYGYRGDVKNLDEFETTIVPSVLKAPIIKTIQESNPAYLNEHNPGWRTLQNISAQGESGKSQAKFKKISMEHYLHCIKTMIESGAIPYNP